MIQMFICAAAVPVYLLYLSIQYLRRGLALYLCWIVSPFFAILSVVIGYFCMAFAPSMIMGPEGAGIGLFFYGFYTAFGALVGAAVILIGLIVVSIIHKLKKSKQGGNIKP